MIPNEPQITPELVASHGLKPDEYERILKLIGRVPTFTELGIFSAMWNEHCSYKSSRVHLRNLPTKAPWVIQGPGENAGVIDIGDGQACVFKMESHNHPSFIEPYQGAATGVGGILRDGIHGATMASASFEEEAEEKRPTVQVGDPFAEKLLLEACLELMASGSVIAIQDMGAAGLTSSAVEMGAKGNLGIELDLDAVPCRETGMSAYEMMLSESQERMLMVLDPVKEKEAETIFRKWGLDFAIVGRTTDTLRFVVKHHSEIKADLPIKELGDEAPLYHRPYVPTPPANPVDAHWVRPPIDNRTALLRLLGSPNLCSKRWIWEQYDHLILGNTIVPPGADAAVVRIGDGPKGLALTTDVIARYCVADPVEGGRQVVAEAWRNLIAVGARPLAITDNLNFGNPERPEIMGQFVGCLQGIGEACRLLDFPVVSGNVSLYNETRGQGILPTPAIGGVGVVDDVAKIATPGFKSDGQAILLIGKTRGWLGQSIYLSELCGREEGAPPPVDLAKERRNGDFISAAIKAGRVTAVHDLAEGGLGVALAEMAIGGRIGARINRLPDGVPAHGILFGEGQARYLV